MLAKRSIGRAGIPRARKSLTAPRLAVQTCHGCTLYKHATQAVFGEGTAHARMVLIGEVPGDSEDLAGTPFVGPSGQLPDRYEIAACKPWLESELELLDPAIVVQLGATAAQSLLGSAFRVTKERGHVLETELATWTFATVHPASVLRAPDDELRRIAKEELIADFELVGDYFRKLG